ncbi:hypothetical protein M514_23710 [Trichuris suis]|uniref:Uncharacterized protein n=1 Tax=Trichuris suis TaxID=68888 RepID=A0A085N3T3_9BILA|nr:hypothetical protein M514_23710 [Trichuris suis]
MWLFYFGTVSRWRLAFETWGPPRPQRWGISAGTDPSCVCESILFAGVGSVLLRLLAAAIVPSVRNTMSPGSVKTHCKSCHAKKRIMLYGQQRAEADKKEIPRIIDSLHACLQDYPVLFVARKLYCPLSISKFSRGLMNVKLNYSTSAMNQLRIDITIREALKAEMPLNEGSHTVDLYGGSE